MKKMHILHTEASPGWGGQEMRILHEAIGMRERGHTVILAVQKGGGLVPYAKKEGFKVYELTFAKRKIFSTVYLLLKIIIKEKIDILNTHSSLDAWMAGFAARLLKKKVIRTRHLSTPIRGGLNRFLLYRCLADTIVTTCEETAFHLRKQMRITKKKCLSIPTGLEPKNIYHHSEKSEEFRHSLGLNKNACLVGTLAVMRGWKGISDLLLAAKELESFPDIKWLIIGGGVSEQQFRDEWKKLELEKVVFFTGHLDYPFAALAALDIFLLLSYANEGVSQAALQAAWLKKPLITTPVGGLKEVCLHNETGLLVPPQSPISVAQAVKTLVEHKEAREEMGQRAHELVKAKFLLCQTLNKMEKVYENL